MMIYPSYVIAGLLVDGRPFGTQGRPGHVAWLALVGAAVMTAWDVVVDPIMSGPGYGAWVWDQGGGYFGVPVHNYVGWLATTFAVFVLYRWYEWVRPRSGAQQTVRWAAALPPGAYGAMLLANLVAGGPPALAVIGPFVMGLPLLSVARPLLEYVRAEPVP